MDYTDNGGGDDSSPSLPAGVQQSQSDSEPLVDALVENMEYPYFSKSRVKTAKTCMRSFMYTYVMGIRFDGNFYTKRGTRIHKAFENYYERLEADVQSGVLDREAAYSVDLMDYFTEDDVGLWVDWVNPFIHHFLLFEERRLEHCLAHDVPLWQFVPHGVEVEGSLDRGDEPRWMGYADAVLHAASVPEVEAEDGYVIVDFKTGKTPKPEYRDEGIFLEGEFYAALFEDELEIAAVAGYYPMNDDFIIAPLRESRRELITDLVSEIQAAETMADFPMNPQPLCKWGKDDADQCDHYDYCDTRWGRGIGPSYS